MNRPPFWAAAAALLLVPLALSACAEEATYAEADMELMAEEATGDAASRSMAAPTVNASQVDAPEAEPASVRQLRRTATLRLRASDYAEALAEARETAAQYAATIDGENSQRYTDRVETTLTLRMPSSRFDSLLAALSELPGEVESRTVSVDDVTRQVADLGARLETKRAAEASLRELLGRSGSIEDILAVQTRLQQVREEIESTEAQLRVLRDEVSRSTITLTVFEASAAGITAGPGFFAQAGRALVAGWDGLLTLMLGLLTVWPVLLIAGVALWWFRRRWSARLVRTRRASPPPVTPPQTAPPATPPQAS